MPPPSFSWEKYHVEDLLSNAVTFAKQVSLAAPEFVQSTVLYVTFSVPDDKDFMATKRLLTGFVAAWLHRSYSTYPYPRLLAQLNHPLDVVQSSFRGKIHGLGFNSSNQPDIKAEHIAFLDSQATSSHIMAHTYGKLHVFNHSPLPAPLQR